MRLLPVVAWLAAELLVPVVAVGAAVVLWRRTHKAASVALLALLVLAEANFSFAPYALGLKNLFPGYQYVSSDGGFEGYECTKSTACTWSVLQEQWSDYAGSHEGVELLRKVPMHPWAFWHWAEYATHPRWRLRYAAPSRAAVAGSQSAPRWRLRVALPGSTIGAYELRTPIGSRPPRADVS